MRQIISLFLILLAATQLAPARVAAQAATQAAAAQEAQAARRQPMTTKASAPLRNADVEALLDAGVSPEVIAAKIKASACEFDTGAAALQRLKAKGATDAVLLAVIDAAAAARPPLPEAAAGSVRVTLPAGTPVEVETVHAVNSAEVRAGDALSLRVTKAVEVGGLTVIEAGAHATGRVVTAKRGRSFGRAGQLAWQVESVVAVDGQRIPLSFADRTKGHSKGGTVATAAVLTGVMIPLAAPVGLLWGFKRGKSAVVPAGRIFAPVVQSAAQVDVKETMNAKR